MGKQKPLIERWKQDTGVTVYRSVEEAKKTVPVYDFEKKKKKPVEKSLFNIAKSDEDKRLVFGWGNISKTITGELVEDLQGDSIEIEDLESSAYDYVLNFRDTGVEHDPSIRKVGRLVESCVFTKEKQQAIGIAPGQVPEGWWVGFYIDDDKIWEDVKNGKLRMFSIEGKAQRVTKAMTFNEIMNEK